MLGARRSVLIAFTCTIFWCFGNTVQGFAGEFGNMQFPSIQNQSREASALALDAISTALKGIAELERARPDISKELLTQGAEQVAKAAKEMENILSKADSDPQFKQYLGQEANRRGITSEDWDFFTKSLEKDKLFIPKSRRDVFVVFVKKTMTLSAGLQNPERRIDDIGDYLRFGGIATRLMRQ